MPSTPEEKAVEAELTDVIRRTMEVYAPSLAARGYVLGDYVVVACFTGFDSDGDLENSMGIYSRDSEVPEYRMLGLLEYASTRVRRQVDQGTKWHEEPDEDDGV